MTNLWTTMVLSSDLTRRQSVASMLSAHGTETFCVSTVRQACEVMAQNEVKLIFCDYMLADGDYRDLLAAFSSKSEAPKVVVMAGSMRPDQYQQARCWGVFEIIPTPCRPTDLEWMVILAKRYDRIRSSELVGVNDHTAPRHKITAAGAA